MKKKLLSAENRISPGRINGSITLSELVDRTFDAYNALRLKEACRLMVERILEPNVTVGLSLAGALTPAGLGISSIIPLIRHGFVDWIVSTGANLYHDTHFALGHSMHRGSPILDDVKLRTLEIVRIYDVLFDYKVLLHTDAFYREIFRSEVFQQTMGTAELNYHIGRFLYEREHALYNDDTSILSTAYQEAVPVYVPAPGDSSTGMNIAALALEGGRLRINPSRDVNETAALVFDAKQQGETAVLIVGGGSPKNFLLQTEPYIQEILGLDDSGHDYFIQMTDARPDTGGLSGATPSEAVSWGKIKPEALPNTVVCYGDATILLPLMTAYVVANHPPRKKKRLYEKREKTVRSLSAAYSKKRSFRPK